MAIDYITVPINRKDKAYLQQFAREKDKTLGEVCRIALQAYIFALKVKKRRDKEKQLKEEEI